MSDRAPVTQGKAGAFAAAHRRFARAVIAIYLGAAALALALLITALGTDQAHQRSEARATLLLETEVRAHSLARHLGLVASELRRLGLRSEVDLLDRNMEPERSLLRLAQEKSTFFDVGIAIVGTDGAVAWAEPEDFLSAGTSFAKESWFDLVKHRRTVRIVTVEPERESDSMLYVVSPIVRSGQFTGALLGAIDLAKGDAFDTEAGATEHRVTLIATHEGAVVYPPKRPPELNAERWRALMTRESWEPFLDDSNLFGTDDIVAGAPVTGSDLVLMTVLSEDALYGPARGRLESRLALGLGVALIPLILLVLLLRRSLRVFRTTQEQAAREERLHMLGEAVNLIAHEIKNSLNGLRLGMDVVLADPGKAGPRRADTIAALRTELHRLSDFTTELLGFSKGIVPRPVALDLANLVRKVAGLMVEKAAEAGAELEIVTPQTGIPVRVDPGLIHSVITNLVGNALDAIAGADPRPHIVVIAAAAGRVAEIRVRDNGPGVSAEVRRALFEPFVTGKPSGVGIGLAMSRKIARAHGGDLVLVRSGPGAEFLLTVPLEVP